MAKSTSASLEITSDGGVTKHILKEGNGQIPALHATCLGRLWHVVCMLSISV